jgi:hypothetical protein
MAAFIAFATAVSLCKKGGSMRRAVLMAGVFWASMMLPVIGGVQSSYAQLPSWLETSPQLVGEARFRLFFFDIYQAALLTPDGRYDGAAPYALRLSYMRDVSSQTIVDTSLDELLRQANGNESKLAEWADWMGQYFPDMKNGDEAVMVALTNGGMALYHNQVKLGQMDDPAFTDAFFAIWLSDNALKPDLSRQLRGLRKE